MNTRAMRWVLVAALAWIPAAARAQARLIAGTETSLPRLVTSHGTYKLGKKPYPAGTRDQWIAAGRALATTPAGYLPPSKTLKGASDNRSYLPPIGDQGSLGSCVHWAGTYYTKSANMKRMNPALNLTQTSNQCSPKFTYNLSNAGADNGGYGHEPFEIFMRYGTASLAQLPYNTDYTSLPTVANFVEGLHRRTTNYVWLWDWNPTATQINELKAWLDAGGVASCGVYAETSFDAWGPGDAPWVGSTCTIDDINHMVTVCGYGTGYYLVANSWTTSFGSNGYIVVDSDYFENYFSDVLYPLEGAYTPATNYAKVQISHGTRSDLRSLVFSVNGATVWSNSPLPKNLPKGTGSFDTDSRNDWQLAVDLSSAAWGGANVVTVRCSDVVSGTAGTLTNFTLVYGGTNYASTNVPVAIPDATGAAASAAVATATPTSAPAFGANPGPLGATTGVARAFTVTASGNPPPGLALQSQTASSGYGFVPATGVLTYTPPLADVGARTFTFIATNAAGAATQTVSVTVYEAPPAAPAAIWASATNAADFTAAWSSVSGATGYRLDVGTNATFSAGGGSGGPATNGYHNGTLGAGTGGTWTETGLTQGSGYLISLSGDVLITPAMDFTASSSETLTFNARTYGGVNAANNAITVSVSTNNGSSWTSLGTRTPLNTTLTAMTPFDLSPYEASQVRVKLENLGASATVGAGIDEVLITNLASSSVAAYVAGYSNRTVAGTSQSVTGLAASATYFFRVRAVNGGGASGNSPTASVTTASAPPPGTPPTLDAIPAQRTTVGEEFTYAVTATEPDADALTFACTSAVDGATWDVDVNTGLLVFNPTAAQLGTNVFVFTAADKDGTSAPVPLSVKVYTAAATNEFTQWVEDQEEDPVDPDFAANADVDGDGQTTYEEYLADTDPAASNSWLRLEGQTADLSRFTFPASSARYYQLEYCTDITNQAGTLVVTNLGWGVPGMVITNDLPSWFGTIRVRLDAP